MNKLIAVLEITRPINIVITFLVVLVSIFISIGELSIEHTWIIAALSASAVAASGNIINDLIDLEIDILNKPNRPLPSGRLSKVEATFLYVLSIILSSLLAVSVGMNALIIVIATILILYIYSRFLKGIPLFGNAAVSFCTGLAFLYGGVVAENIKSAVIPAIFAFLINFIREVLKDIEDIEGDRKENLSTFPIKYGIPNTKTVILILSLLLLLSTIIPFLYQVYKIEYLFFVLFLVDLPLVIILKNIYSNDFITKISKYSLMLKIIMVAGLFSIIIGQ